MSTTGRGWRLVGLDAMLIDSGEPEEAEQAAWLDRVMEEAGGRPESPGFSTARCFSTAPRRATPDIGRSSRSRARALMALVRRHRVALVASGHLHKARDFQHDGTRYIWSPASSFLVGAMFNRRCPARKRLGAVLYDLAPGFTAEIANMPGLTQHWLDEVIHEVYPRPARRESPTPCGRVRGRRIRFGLHPGDRLLTPADSSLVLPT